MGRRLVVARKLRAADPVADLKRRIARAPRAIRRLTHAWWQDHGFAEQIASAGTAEVGKRVGIILIKQRSEQLKRAGMVVLGELVGEHLHTLDLEAFGSLLHDGHIAEPALVEAFATRVLGKLLERSEIRANTIYDLARWRHGERAWQRHAMCLAFLGLAPRAREVPGLTEMICAICASVVWSIDEIDQRAVGRLLRELSECEPDRVEEFFHRYCRFMSKACARTVVSRYAPDRRDKLLAHHKRATTIT
ncbi:MAG: DNA alkylation repair protein [Kofleriaceae bacterium]